MIGRKVVLGAVAATALLAGTGPASASTPYTQVGLNTGDDGFISLTFNSPAGATRRASGGPVGSACEFHQQNKPGSNQAVLVVEGHAHASPNGVIRPVSTGVRCVLKNYFTGAVVVDYQEATESANSVWLQPQVKELSLATSYVVCSSTTVHWSDNSVTTNATLACQLPI